jgi:hypothetical protein
MYESFRRYQTSMLEQFDHLAEEYKFKVIDATPDPRKIFEKLRAGITQVLEVKSQRTVPDLASQNAAAAAGQVTPLQPVASPAVSRMAESGGEDSGGASPKPVAEAAGPGEPAVDLKV